MNRKPPTRKQKLYNFYEPALYDLELGEADDTATTVDFYRQALGEPSKTFLDIGAGTGRITIPLILAGHQAISVDSSREMTKALVHKLKKQGLTEEATTLHARFGPRRNHPQVDIAIAPDDFLLHLLSTRDLLSFFADLHTWLPPGAAFITDTRELPPRFLEKCSRPPYTTKNYGLVRAAGDRTHQMFYQTSVWKSYQPGDQILTTHYRYETINPHGRVTQTLYRVLEQRIHRNAEIISASRQNGFKLVRQCERNTSSRQSQQAIGGTLIFRTE